MIDVEALVRKVSDAHPCGESLDGTDELALLEIAATGRSEQSMIPGGAPLTSPPRWSEVRTGSLELLGRTKDLRVAMLLARSLTALGSVDGLSQGCDLIRRLIEEHWNGLHPQLDPDEPNDLQIRLSALADLSSPMSLSKDLRDSQLLKVRGEGVLLVRDFEAALGKLKPRDGNPLPNEARARAVLATALAEQGALPGIDAAMRATDALSKALTEHFGTASATDLSTVRNILQTLQSLWPLRARPPEPADGESSKGPEAPQVCAQESSAVSPLVNDSSTPCLSLRALEIASREDASLLIDKLIDFIERTEPTNPAPLLLKRSKRFMGMSFIEIVKEISPEVVAKIDVICGPREAEVPVKATASGATEQQVNKTGS